MKSKNINYWGDSDFNENKLYWKNRPSDENFKVRIENFKLIDKILKDADIFYFLEGNTLNYIYSASTLYLNDLDDVLGIFIKDKERLLSLEKIFNNLGFFIIRKTIIWFLFAETNDI